MNTKSLSFLRSTLIVALVAAFVLVGCASGPTVPEGTVVGSGKVAAETREITGFTSVEYSSAGYLTIVQGDVEGITIQAEDNILPLITSEVVDGVLNIGIKDNTAIKTTSMIQITLTVKDLVSVENLASGYVSINGLIVSDLAYKASGSGNLKLAALEAKNLVIDLTGSGAADVRGTADTLTANLTGSGALDGSKLTVLSADLVNAGSGNAIVNASKKLTATLSGSGNVSYIGAPEVTQTASGSGTVTAQ